MLNNKGRLEGKVALVTGGSRGIGKAIAIRLAQEGAEVIINYQRNKEKAEKVSKLVDQICTTKELNDFLDKIKNIENKEQIRELSDYLEKIGNNSYFYKADVSNFDEVIRMRDEILNKFGKLDILVNNAGIVRDKSFMKMTKEMWKDVLSINLDGTFNCTKAFIENMVKRGYGRIINISSVIGEIGNFGQANYAASKAGMIGFTKSLAKEFARKGITVNAIAPGFIDTDMVRSVPDKVMQEILKNIPLGRLGKASEVAGAVVYLASEDGNYITGQVLNINGGMYV